MENHSNFVQNFKTFFSNLSHEEQYNTIVPILMSADGFLKWRLKCLLNSLETPDLLTLLPSEIQLLILSLVDGSSLLKACQVSRRWNESIRDYNQLWREKSREIGVHMELKPDNISWQKAFLTSWKQLHLMKSGKSFKEKYVDLQNSRRAVKAVDYNDGYLCTVTEDDRINIWQLEFNIPVLSFLVDQAVSCIQFRRHSTLVCGHFTGILTSWDMTDMSDLFFRSYDTRPIFEDLDDNVSSEFSLLKMKFKMHSAPVFSCDFSEDIQLLVSGGADETIKFWCLRKGTLLRTLSSRSHWVLRVLLTPFDNSVRKIHSILTMTRDSVDRYQWPCEPPGSASSDITYGYLSRIENTASVRLNEANDNFITPGLQVSARTVGLVKQDLQEKQATLELLDRTSLALRVSLPLSFKVRKLMALGERFALLLTVGKVLFTSTLVVLDIRTGTIVGTHTIPHSKMTTPDGAQMIVGDSQWLDGLAGWKFLRETKDPSVSYDIHDEGEMSSWDSQVGRTSPDCATADIYGVEIASDLTRSERIGAVGLDESKAQGGGRGGGSRWGGSGRSLVMAAGVRSEEGRVFTLWWGLDEACKTKVD